MIKGFFVYRLSIWLFLLLPAQVLLGQSNFLYIQSENNQPYNLAWKGNTYGSTGKGYLFIPQLQNGNHTITISFPGDKYPEYNFAFTVDNKPKGYALRITQEGEWMLMDMVSTELLRGTVAGMPQKIGGEKQVQKLYDRSGEEGVDQRYRIQTGSRVDTVSLFIQAPVIKQNTAGKSTSGPSGGNGLQGAVRSVERAEKTAEKAERVERAANKVKIPLVAEAYGTPATRPKKGKQQ